MEEFKKTCYVKPTYIKDDLFSSEFDKRMMKISKELTEYCQEKLERKK